MIFPFNLQKLPPISVLFATLLLSTLTTAKMQLMLREGIVGGFVAPKTTRIIEISQDEGSAMIVHHVLPNGAPRDAFYSTQGSLSPAQVQALESQLLVLKQLPNQQPPFGEDIFGLDTSIMYQDDDGFTWANGGPEGCSRSSGGPQVSPQQKEQFRSLVNAIIAIAGQTATTAI